MGAQERATPIFFLIDRWQQGGKEAGVITAVSLPMADLPGGTSVVALAAGMRKGFLTGIGQVVCKRGTGSVRRGATCAFR